MSDDARHIVAAIIAVASHGNQTTREHTIREYERVLEALKELQAHAASDNGVSIPAQTSAPPKRDV